MIHVRIRSVSHSQLKKKSVNKSYIARMPKQPMKYRNLPPWPEAKRGKKRAKIKRPAKYISMKKKNEKILYVRAPGVQKKFKKERLRYGVSVQTLTSKGPFHSAPHQRWPSTNLERQAKPTLQPRKLESIEVPQSQLCVGTPLLQKGCQKLMQPHQFHPIFFSGAGSCCSLLSPGRCSCHINSSYPRHG